MLRRFSIIALAALACAGPLTAQTYSRIPTADDEKQLTAIFRQVDANHDGRISKVEMTSFGVTHRLGTIVRNEGWRDIDANHNGTLELREFIVGMVEARADGFGRSGRK